MTTSLSVQGTNSRRTGLNEVVLKERSEGPDRLSMQSRDDRAAFDEVFLPHMAEAYRLAQWLTGNANDAEDVQHALAELPAQFREVIVLREMNQLNYRDIAEITNVPIGTVMSRLSRGRQLLTTLLGDRK